MQKTLGMDNPEMVSFILSVEMVHPISISLWTLNINMLYICIKYATCIYHMHRYMYIFDILYVTCMCVY